MSRSLDALVSAYDDTFAYALDNAVMLPWAAERILERLKPTDAVLELGIGHGETCVRFASHVDRYVVLDGSAAVIDRFHRVFPDSSAEVVQGFFEEFTTDADFDAIVMGFVLEHVDDPIEVLARFRSYLRPGGRCFVTVPNAQSLHRRFGFEAGLLDDLQTLGAGDHALGHQRLYTTPSLESDLERAGYRVVSREGLFLKPFTTHQIESLDLGDDVLRAMCVVGRTYPELSCALLFEATVDP